MKKCSVCLIIRETYVIISLTYAFETIRSAQSKEFENTVSQK